MTRFFRSLFFIFLSVGLFTQCVFLNSVSIPLPDSSSRPYEETVIRGTDTDKIAIISLSGVISDEGKESFFGGAQDSPIALLKESLKMAESDRDVRGVILKINSPGGTVTASDIIYTEVLSFRKKTGIPVVTVFMDVGASGAYYIAMATDAVYAHPTTVTGSIGVVMQGINVKEGLDKIGVKDQSITSGANKALGSPLQELKPEQREILQGIVNSMYERFFSVVREGRPQISESKLRSLSDGRVFTGTQALSNGLVDKIGYFDDFVEELMKHPKYRRSPGNTNPKLVTYVRGKKKVDNIYQNSMEWKSPSLIDKIMNESSGVRFLYLWSI
jgi:protease-4